MTVSIKRVLIVGVIGLQVISVCLILASSFLTSQRVLRQHATDIMTNIATFTIHEAQNYLKPAQDAAQLTQRLANSKVISSENRTALEQYLYDQLSLHSSFAGIYLGFPSGAFIYVSRSGAKVAGGFRTKLITFQDNLKITELIWKDAAQQELMREFDPRDDYDPTARPWYIRAREERQTIWTEPYIFFTSKQPGVTSASPVFNAAGELTGVVGVDVEIADLSTFLSRLKIGQHGRAFIVNTQGDVVAFPDLSKVTWPSESGEGHFRLTKIDELDDILSRKAFSSLQRTSDRFDLDQSLFSFFRHDGRKYHAMFAPFANPQWPWIIGIYLPEDDYLGPIKRNQLINIYIMLGIATAGSLIGWVIVRSIVRPMTAFQLESQAIRENNLDTTLDKHSVIKEIQETADSFAQMKAGLKSSLQENSDLMRELQSYAEDLRLKELHLRASFTSLVNFADALIVLDQQHAMKFLNPAAEKLLGIRADDRIGQRFPFPIEPDRSTEVTEVKVEPSDSAAVIAEMRVVQTEWEGHSAWLVALRDITERKHLDAQLRQSERLASLGTFAAGMAHELNNPLGAIQITTEYAQDALATGPEHSVVRDCLTDILGDAQRCAQIVKRVLHFARPANRVKLPVPLHPLIRMVEAHTQQYVEQNGGRLNLIFASEPPTIIAYEEELELVFVNLIRNAVEASGPGSPIAIRTEVGDGEVQVSVQDLGPGLSEAEQQRVFDPFYTTRETSGGTGLGLSIVHRIITDHDGRIAFESRPGQGTTVQFQLPLAPPP